MSAGALVQAAFVAALRDGLGITVFDAPPVRGAVPHAVVGEPELTDWSTKDWTGREGRVAVSLYDEGERPVRLRALAGQVEARLAGVMPDLGEGWRLVSMRLVRARIAKASRERWVATVEMRVRLWRDEGV